LGEATIRDDRDGHYIDEEEPGQPTKVYTVGQVLAAWRAAERRLESLSPDTAEWAAARAEIETFRVEYRRLASDGQTRRQRRLQPRADA
jgi:hypothetical protein